MYEELQDGTVLHTGSFLHFDYISKVADGFKIIAHTADCPVAAAQNAEIGRAHV